MKLRRQRLRYGFKRYLGFRGLGVWQAVLLRIDKGFFGVVMVGMEKADDMEKQLGGRFGKIGS